MNGLPSNISPQNISIETQKELAQNIINEIKPLQESIKAKREEILNLNLVEFEKMGQREGIARERKIERLNLEVNDLQMTIDQKIDQVRKILEKL